ncbi:MAG: hypothetical protein E7631_09985 [Ruminococcaceae bacterium]|nr:hypothetical protein [Oscillospiraceae bacterium]
MIFTLILLFMIAIYTCQSLACSRFGKYYPGDPAKTSSVFSVLYGGVCMVFTLVFTACTGGFPLTISLPTVLFGLANGIVLTTYNQFLLKSSAMGPYSIVMIFMLSGGLLIPVLWSVIAEGNALNTLQWIAIVLTLVAFLILNMPKKGEKATLPFILSCTVLGIANGVYGILMNSQQAMTANTENAGMIVFTFGTSAVLSFLLLLLPAKQEKFAPGKAVRSSFTFNKACIAWGLGSALSASVAVNILMWILSKVNVAVVYAITNGGVLLVSVLISLLFLGEKCTLTKAVGILLSTAAIVILSI